MTIKKSRRIRPTGFLNPAKSYQRISPLEFMLQASKLIGNLDNFVGWHLKFTQFYYCKPGEEEISLRIPISSSIWRTSLFLACFLYSLHSVGRAIYDTLTGPGLQKLDAITAGIRGLLVTAQTVVYFYFIQNVWKNEETVSVYNSVLRFEKSLAKTQRSFARYVYEKNLREKRQVQMALVTYFVALTFFLIPPTYMWVLLRRPEIIPSFFGSMFKNTWYGFIFALAEFVWATTAFGYSYTIVVELLMLGLFAGSRTVAILEGMRRYVHENCKSMHDWTQVIRIHEGLRILVNDANVAINPLFLPMALPALTFILVFVNYGVIRIFSRQESLEEFGMFFPLLLGIINLAASRFAAQAMNALGIFPVISKEVLREGRKQVSLFRALSRNEERTRELRVFEKRIGGMRSFALQNSVDGPITEVVGLYLFGNITVYTCNLLLMF